MYNVSFLTKTRPTQLQVSVGLDKSYLNQNTIHIETY